MMTPLSGSAGTSPGGSAKRALAPNSAPAKLSAANLKKADGKPSILETVTRNAIVRAATQARLASGGSVSDRARSVYSSKSRGMTMYDLSMEKIQMQRLGFYDIVRTLDLQLERLRDERQRNAEMVEQKLITSRVNMLMAQQKRRRAAHEKKMEQDLSELEVECDKEMERMKRKHERMYRSLVEETASRATGGISMASSNSKYIGQQNKSASYRTRRPTYEVIRYRQNAARLRNMGRISEALRFEEKAAEIDEKLEEAWRRKIEGSITSSAWGGGKSKLEQLLEQQDRDAEQMKGLLNQKMIKLEDKHERFRRLFDKTLESEQRKVIAFCKAQAKKREKKDLAAEQQERNKMSKMEGKSDGLKNISANILEEDESDDELLIGDGEEQMTASRGSAMRRRGSITWKGEGGEVIQMNAGDTTNENANAGPAQAAWSPPTTFGLGNNAAQAAGPTPPAQASWSPPTSHGLGDNAPNLLLQPAPAVDVLSGLPMGGARPGQRSGGGAAPQQPSKPMFADLSSDDEDDTADLRRRPTVDSIDDDRMSEGERTAAMKRVMNTELESDSGSDDSSAAREKRAAKSGMQTRLGLMFRRKGDGADETPTGLVLRSPETEAKQRQARAADRSRSPPPPKATRFDLSDSDDDDDVAAAAAVAPPPKKFPPRGVEPKGYPPRGVEPAKMAKPQFGELSDSDDDDIHVSAPPVKPAAPPRDYAASADNPFAKKAPSPSKIAVLSDSDDDADNDHDDHHDEGSSRRSRRTSASRDSKDDGSSRRSRRRSRSASRDSAGGPSDDDASAFGLSASPPKKAGGGAATQFPSEMASAQSPDSPITRMIRGFPSQMQDSPRSMAAAAAEQRAASGGNMFPSQMAEPEAAAAPHRDETATSAVPASPADAERIASCFARCSLVGGGVPTTANLLGHVDARAALRRFLAGWGAAGLVDLAIAGLAIGFNDTDRAQTLWDEHFAATLGPAPEDVVAAVRDETHKCLALLSVTYVPRFLLDGEAADALFQNSRAGREAAQELADSCDSLTTVWLAAAANCAAGLPVCMALASLQAEPPALVYANAAFRAATHVEEDITRGRALSTVLGAGAEADAMVTAVCCRRRAYCRVNAGGKSAAVTALPVLDADGAASHAVLLWLPLDEKANVVTEQIMLHSAVAEALPLTLECSEPEQQGARIGGKVALNCRLDETVRVLTTCAFDTPARAEVPTAVPAAGRERVADACAGLALAGDVHGTLERIVQSPRAWKVMEAYAAVLGCGGLFGLVGAAAKAAELSPGSVPRRKAVDAAYAAYLGHFGDEYGPGDRDKLLAAEAARVRALVATVYVPRALAEPVTRAQLRAAFEADSGQRWAADEAREATGTLSGDDGGGDDPRDVFLGALARALELARSPAMVFDLAAKGAPVLVYANPEFQRITGRAASELHGTSLAAAVGGDLAEDWEGIARDVGAGSTCELLVQQKCAGGGPAPALLSLVPVAGAHGEGARLCVAYEMLLEHGPRNPADNLMYHAGLLATTPGTVGGHLAVSLGAGDGRSADFDGRYVPRSVGDDFLERTSALLAAAPQLLGPQHGAVMAMTASVDAHAASVLMDLTSKAKRPGADGKPEHVALLQLPYSTNAAVLTDPASTHALLGLVKQRGGHGDIRGARFDSSDQVSGEKGWRGGAAKKPMPKSPAAKTVQGAAIAAAKIGVVDAATTSYVAASPVKLTLDGVSADAWSPTKRFQILEEDGDNDRPSSSGWGSRRRRPAEDDDDSAEGSADGGWGETKASSPRKSRGDPGFGSGRGRGRGRGREVSASPQPDVVSPRAPKEAPMSSFLAMNMKPKPPVSPKPKKDSWGIRTMIRDLSPRRSRSKSPAPVRPSVPTTPSKAAPEARAAATTPRRDAPVSPMSPISTSPRGLAAPVREAALSPFLAAATAGGLGQGVASPKKKADRSFFSRMFGRG